jgi:hypothetical protein
MQEQGRGETFCDAYYNPSRDDEWHRQEKGRKYAAARKAEWEEWRDSADAAIPQYGSTRTANQGRNWQRVGRVAAALAAARTPGADAASTSVSTYARRTVALYLPAGASWTLILVVVMIFIILFVIAYFCIRCRIKTKNVNNGTQTDESGPIAGDIYVSPAGECYHKAEKCRGLKVARSYNAKRPCNICVE